jgi:hypothetical protein
MRYFFHLFLIEVSNQFYLWRKIHSYSLTSTLFAGSLTCISTLKVNAILSSEASINFTGLYAARFQETSLFVITIARASSLTKRKEMIELRKKIISSVTFVGPPLWSSRQSSWLQIQRFGFDSRGYQIFWEVVGLKRGPLSLVSIIEELLKEKIAAENTTVGIRHDDHVALSIRKSCH